MSTLEAAKATPPPKRRDFHAGALIVISGVFLACGGSCLLSSSSSASVATFDNGDKTRVLFIDGLWCINGYCTNFLDDIDCCESMRALFTQLRYLEMVAGILMCVLSAFMFCALLLRIITETAKEIFVNSPWAVSLHITVTSWRKKVSHGVPAVLGLVATLSLLGICIAIIIESIKMISTPLCPETPGHFNVSLNELPRFAMGRGLYLNFAGAGVVIAVLLMFCVWGVVFIVSTFSEIKDDDDDEDIAEVGDEEQQPVFVASNNENARRTSSSGTKKQQGRSSPMVSVGGYGSAASEEQQQPPQLRKTLSPRGE